MPGDVITVKLKERDFVRKMTIIGVYETDNIIFKDIICYIQKDKDSGNIFIELDAGMTLKELRQTIIKVEKYLRDRGHPAE